MVKEPPHLRYPTWDSMIPTTDVAHHSEGWFFPTQKYRKSAMGGSVDLFFVLIRGVAMI